MSVLHIAIGIMAAAIFALIWWLVGKQCELDEKRNLLLLARQDAGNEHHSAQRGFKARDREIATLKDRVAQLEERERNLTKWKHEYEEALDKISQISAEHARPF